MLSAPRWYTIETYRSIRLTCCGFISMLLVADADAQYKGGGDDGHGTLQVARAVLADPSAHRGGNSDGVTIAMYNQQLISDGMVFWGGASDGTAIASFAQRAVSANEPYYGGAGTGFARQAVDKQILDDPSATKGGTGTGFVVANLSALALLDPDAFKGGQDDGQASLVFSKRDLYDPTVFTGGTADGFVVSSYAKNAALPVVLTGFTAQWARSSALLRWTTASSINLARFRIERSTDGNTFSALDSIPAKANGSIAQQYEFTDKQVADIYAAQGKFFYRLRSFDTDGKSALSAVVILSRSVSGSFVANIFPNPANAVVNVSVNAGADIAKMKLVLTDLNGRILLSRSLAGTLTTIQTNQFIPGQYYLVLFSNNQQAATIPLIIQH